MRVFGVDDTYHLFPGFCVCGFFFSLPKKWCSHGLALSDTKIMRNGPIVSKPCMGRNRETNKDS